MTPDGTIVDPYNLRVGVLDSSVTTSDLYSVFGQFGSISSARMMPGHGFVCFVSKDDARTAMMKMDGALLGGSRIKITYHEPNQHQLPRTKPKSKQQQQQLPRRGSSTSSGRPLPPIIDPSPLPPSLPTATRATSRPKPISPTFDALQILLDGLDPTKVSELFETLGPVAQDREVLTALLQQPEILKKMMKVQKTTDSKSSSSSASTRYKGGSLWVATDYGIEERASS